MRLIDADALMSSVLKWLPPDPCGQEDKEYPFETDICASLLTEIEEAPTVEPEQHRGHWIGGDGSYICSECNGNPIDFIDTMGASFDAYVETPMNYCPNCGADMRRIQDV